MPGAWGTSAGGPVSSHLVLASGATSPSLSTHPLEKQLFWESSTREETLCPGHSQHQPSDGNTGQTPHLGRPAPGRSSFFCPPPPPVMLSRPAHATSTHMDMERRTHADPHVHFKCRNSAMVNLSTPAHTYSQDSHIYIHTQTHTLTQAHMDIHTLTHTPKHMQTPPHIHAPAHTHAYPGPAATQT